MDGHMKQWEGVAVSVRGTKHERVGLPCQDASVLVRPDPSSCFLLVADGAGSAEHSAEGSRVAVQAATEFLGELYRFWRPSNEREWLSLLRCCMLAARQELIGLSAAGRPLRSFDTTLLVLGMDSRYAAAANVGDCGGIIAESSSELLALAAPENGEYVNETYFLTEDPWDEHLRLACHDGRARFAFAFSDGLDLIALQRGEPFAGFVNGLTEQLRRVERQHRSAALRGYLRDAISGKRTDDDMTLAAAWQAHEAE